MVRLHLGSHNPYLSGKIISNVRFGEGEGQTQKYAFSSFTQGQDIKRIQARLEAIIAQFNDGRARIVKFSFLPNTRELLLTGHPQDVGMCIQLVNANKDDYRKLKFNAPFHTQRTKDRLTEYAQCFNRHHRPSEQVEVEDPGFGNSWVNIIGQKSSVDGYFDYILDGDNYYNILEANRTYQTPVW